MRLRAYELTLVKANMSGEHAMAVVNEDSGPDAAAGTDTEYAISVGDRFHGRLDGRLDRDWISVELREGTPYQISLTSASNHARADLLLRLVNPAGEVVTANDDIDYAAGNRNALVRFHLEESGVYYIVADRFRGTTAENWSAYTLRVQDLEAQAYAAGLVIGGDDDDVLAGGEADDLIRGGKGDDWLVGGPGADVLVGGPGVDFASYSMSAVGVTVYLYDGTARGGDAEGDRFEGLGAGVVEPPQALPEDEATATTPAAEAQALQENMAPAATPAAEKVDIEHLTGSAWDDELAGDVAGNRLFGLGGDDALDGRAGDDVLVGGAGDDVLVGGPGADRLRGGTGIDTAAYKGSQVGVRVYLYDGVSWGGDAEGDRFVGVEEVEYVDAEGEVQRVLLPDIEDLAGSAHGDVLAGDRRDNRLDGGAGNDTLYGGPGGGDDLLRGGPGADRLYGGGGRDTLVGGPGADVLIGGPGADFASYGTSAVGVTVRLYDGTARGGDAEGDRFEGLEAIVVEPPRALPEDAATAATPAAEKVDIEHLAGSAWDDELAGDVAGNWLFGLGGDDVLDGRAGDDWLEGGAGADRLTGGAGSDVASYARSDAGVIVRLHSSTARGGDAEGDRFVGMDEVEYVDAEGEAQRVLLPDIEDLVGSAHGDVLAGDRRDNRLDGGAGNDTLYGGPGGGDDLLRGGAGADRLYGGGGRDTLVGGPGADVLVGGPGADFASYRASAAGVTVRLYDGTARGGDAEGDRFEGREAIAGEPPQPGAADETLQEDEATAGTPATEDQASQEDEGTAAMPAVEDQASQEDEGTDAMPAVEDHALQEDEGTAAMPAAEKLDIEHLAGSAWDDELAGDVAGNWLLGLGGDDVLDGRAGDDWLEGGAGADRLTGGAGSDVASYARSDAGVIVRLHSSTARGGAAEGDRFEGMDEVEYVDAEGEAQRVLLPDIEDLVGSAHGDVLAGDRRDNRLDGGAGDDALYGGPGGGDDLLRGGVGADRLYGGGGHDTLMGGPGNDRLSGAAGDDAMFGGAGADLFVIAPDNGNDYLGDFLFGDDRIDLTDFADIESVDDLRIEQQAGDLIVDLSRHSGGQLRLYDLQPEELADDHFIFYVHGDL